MSKTVDEETVDRYRQAAEQGSAEAMCKLGWLHAYGLGVPEDARTAADCWRQAAAGGSVEAMFYLGWLDAYMPDVPKDEQKVAELYRKAAKHVHAAAMQWLYGDGEGCKADG